MPALLLPTVLKRQASAAGDRCVLIETRDWFLPTWLADCHASRQGHGLGPQLSSTTAGLVCPAWWPCRLEGVSHSVTDWCSLQSVWWVCAAISVKIYPDVVPILNQGKHWGVRQPHSWSCRAHAALWTVIVPLPSSCHVPGTVCLIHYTNSRILNNFNKHFVSYLFKILLVQHESSHMMEQLVLFTQSRLLELLTLILAVSTSVYCWPYGAAVIRQIKVEAMVHQSSVTEDWWTSWL